MEGIVQCRRTAWSGSHRRLDLEVDGNVARRTGLTQERRIVLNPDRIDLRQAGPLLRDQATCELGCLRERQAHIAGPVASGLRVQRIGGVGMEGQQVLRHRQVMR